MPQAPAAVGVASMGAYTTAAAAVTSPSHLQTARRDDASDLNVHVTGGYVRRTTAKPNPVTSQKPVIKIAGSLL